MMGRWCAAVVGLWAFGLMSPSETAASSQGSAPQVVESCQGSAAVAVNARDGVENRRKRGKLKTGSVQGFCKPSDIRSKVKRRAGAIRACYERALMRNPKLAGKVNVRWTIGMDGRVMGAVSASGLGPVGKCVAKKIQRIRFKPPEGGVCVIRWPFVFSPGR